MFFTRTGSCVPCAGFLSSDSNEKFFHLENNMPEDSHEFTPENPAYTADGTSSPYSVTSGSAFTSGMSTVSAGCFGPVNPCFPFPFWPFSLLDKIRRRLGTRPYKLSSEPLLQAIYRNDPEEVARLLCRGVSANTTDEEKSSALHEAVLNHAVVSVGFRGLADYREQQYLLEKVDGRGFPSWLGRSGVEPQGCICVRPPLPRLVHDENERKELAHKACMIVGLLLAFGASRIAEDKLGRTPLYLACLHNCERLVDLILGNVPITLDVQNIRDVADKLDPRILANKLDGKQRAVVANAGRGRGPLAIAVLEGHLDQARRLLQAGANADFCINLEDIDGCEEFNFVQEWFRMQKPKLCPSHCSLESVSGISLLACAILRGRSEMVDLLLRYGARTRFGAVLELRPNKTGEKKVDTGYPDLSGPAMMQVTPFYLAAAVNDGAAARALLRAGGTGSILPDAEDPGYSSYLVGNRQPLRWSPSPLPAAAEQENERMVLLLLDVRTRVVSGGVSSSGAETALAETLDVNVRDCLGRTPLLNASQKGVMDSVRALLDAGANPNWKDSDGRTPLSLAAAGGHEQTVSLLLGVGADPLLVDNRGRGALLYAAKTGSAPIVRALLNAGANPNGQDLDGKTPLLWAVHHRNLEMLQLLLGAGALPNTKAVQGKTTPLILAVERHDTAFVKVLVNAGANPNDCSETGKCPLSLAIKTGDAWMTKCLLDAGADPHSPESLECAVNSCRTRFPWMIIVRMLLKRLNDSGKDWYRAECLVNRRNLALQLAVIAGDIDAARFLIANGANPNTVDKAKRTALTLAELCRNSDMAGVLRNAGGH